MPLFVQILRPPEEGPLAHLRAHLHPSIHLTLGSELPSHGKVDILVAGWPKREDLIACPDLRTLIIPFAGVPEETRNLLLDYPHITVHNLHYNAAATSEVAIALLLAAAKFLIPIDRTFRSHDWTPRYQPNPSVLLEGKTVLVLGYGAIGRRVAQGCLGLGMRVRAVRRDPSKSGSDPDVEIHASHDLPQLLPETEILIICLPLTSETEGRIDKHELDLLPQDAILVNVARGSIVNESALYQALKVGKLYAAGLDVWYNYPEDESTRSRTAPSQFPFHELDNVVMSPHRAGGAMGLEVRRMDALAELLNAAIHGEPMLNKVDITLGY
ncbi:MAG TPA: hydroxyacid dehydrogenase [Anaerolineae bacterium]|nr:hydroxyacid dehydrogenase [Anaerolineae bacterium]